MEVVLSMLFLIISNIDIFFSKLKLIWNSYTIAEALFFTKWVEFKFAKAALNTESETFVMHIAVLEAPLAKMSIHFSQKAQIAALN